jgi:cation/acetate symporter
VHAEIDLSGWNIMGPYDHPALFSVPPAFLVIVVSVRADNERDAYADQFVRAQTGLGATSASRH